ncbi:hypothetical protein [Terrisporobacter sp.]|uniref:hypothetical protein n=1 Tax=Terrisporobacter sp. TaxID=1965305 RepID=UPI002896F142|nr:hypothetical protein [Terrisporobacter sp.]
MLDELNMVVDMFITTEFISTIMLNKIEEKEFSLKDFENQSVNYSTQIVINSIKDIVRDKIQQECFNKYSYKEINKVMGNTLWNTVKCIIKTYKV